MELANRPKLGRSFFEFEFISKHNLSYVNYRLTFCPFWYVWSNSVHFGPIKSIQSTSVHLVHFGLFWSNSVHLVLFGPLRSILVYLVHSVHFSLL